MEMKVPLKIKNFYVVLQRKEILTKDNLAKCNWQCCLCDHEETARHLFIKCPFAKKIGASLTWRLISLLQLVLHIFSVIGLMELSKMRKPTLELVYVLLCGLYGMFGTILSLTNQLFHHFAGFPFGYPLDPYVVLSPADGAAPGHGFWVQPFGNGCSGYIQPIWQAV
jgi:hypothetical protein